MAKHLYPILAVLMVSVIWGLSFLFTKGVLFFLTPFQLLGLRFTVAALALSLLVLLRLATVNIRLRQLPELLKVAFWQPVLYFICETYGVKNTSASESSIIISLVPVAVLLFSGVMLKERINVRQALCVAASVAGVILMAAAGGGALGSEGSHLAGVLWLLGAVLSAALYTILSRRAGAHFSPFEVTLVMMWAGALVFGAAGLAEGVLGGRAAALGHALGRREVVAGLLYLGLVASVAAFFLYNYAVAHVPASRAAVFLNLVPVTSCAAGFLFFGERLGPWQLGGAVLILLGVWGTNYFAVPEAGNLSAGKLITGTGTGKKL